MDSTLRYFFDHAEGEFEGESFNGASLMKTLDGLSAELAASRETWEGYSPWGVALHLAYYKYYFLRAAVGIERTGPYPLPKGKSGFGKPAEVSEAAWAELRAYLRRIHREAMDALLALDPGRYGEPMPGWEIPWGQAIAWFLGHDSYHAAQIRSMGVSGLKEASEEE